MRVIQRLLLLASFVLCDCVLSAPVQDEDKNGVSPNTISRPTGPGSLEGLGDAFQPALNTGTSKYSVNLAMPPGVAGFTPSLSFEYNSGNGQGPLGIGWLLDLGSIHRQSEKGLPRYIDDPQLGELPDRFVGMEGEELVPLKNGYYLAKVEGTYLRYRRTGDRWEAHTKSGIKLEFGRTSDARVSDETGTQTYRWCLERQTDTNGNVIDYTYLELVDGEGQVYLTRIDYGPGDSSRQNGYFAVLSYEPRNDVFDDYRSGYLVRTSMRLSKVQMFFTNSLIRTYDLTYDANGNGDENDDHWSFLTKITQFGNLGGALPSTTFDYSVFDACNGSSPVTAAGSIITSTTNLVRVIDNPLVEFADVNADGLPDILDTSLGHAAIINNGHDKQLDQITWSDPVDMAPFNDPVTDFDLSQPGVHLADMTGDGVADFVVATDFEVEYFENLGNTTWGEGQLVSTPDPAPPTPFAPQHDNVKVADIDFNKQIDILQSQEGAYLIWLKKGDGTYSTPILSGGPWYINDVIQLDDPGVHLADMNGDRLSDVVMIKRASVIICPHRGFGEFDLCNEVWLPDGFIDVSPGGNLSRTSLQDINGDGLSDLVVERATNDDLKLWINRGNGTFAPSCTVTDLPVSANAVVRWIDINGNGTTDLVYSDSFLQGSKINAVDVAQLLAGTDHINLLTAIDNGYGRRTEIFYDSSTRYMVQAFAAGNPWTDTVPMSVDIVSRTETSIGLDLDGYTDQDLLNNPTANGDLYITEYSYRDGYYDPLEKQFRGFSFVKQIAHGHERFKPQQPLGPFSPTLVTRYRFHTGAPDCVDNDGDGMIDEDGDIFIGREEEPLKGMELWRETAVLTGDASNDGDILPNSQVFDRASSPVQYCVDRTGECGDATNEPCLQAVESPAWEIRELSTATGGLTASIDASYLTDDDYMRDVRQAVRRRVDTEIIELDSAQAKITRVITDIDPFGNEILTWNHGDLGLDCSGAPGSTSCDDLYEQTEFVLDSNALANWILDRPKRVVQRMGGPNGAFVSEAHNYYDGPVPFEGLPLGVMGVRGLLKKTEAFLGDGSSPAITARSYIRDDPDLVGASVDVLRQDYDQYGNPIALRDANGNDRHLAYDLQLNTYPTTETIVVGGGSDDLIIKASFDYLFGQPAKITDFNGHESEFIYDEFGRLVEERLPGDPLGRPTRVYDYNLDSPISSITATSQPNEGSPLNDIVTTQYFDGLGRKLGLHEHGGGGVAGVMRDVTYYNTRGQPWKILKPYNGAPFDSTGNLPAPGGSQPFYLTDYDAAGRTIRTETPPDINGQTAVSTKFYQPLTVIEFDGEDNCVGTLAQCPHQGTPKTLISDGLGRVIQVEEISNPIPDAASNDDTGTFVTQYRYVMPDLLAEIQDANNNIKYMRYDGLGRKIFMNDLNRGLMHYDYDSVGNLTSTADAKSQQINYTYDGANRLKSEDYLDDGHPLSFSVALNGRPDVVYHYDVPSPQHPSMSNTKGKLAWIEDLSGMEYRGYNARGALEHTVKRIGEPPHTSADNFVTATRVDNLGRIHQINYPDGAVVRQEYDARGNLKRIPNFATNMTYTSSGQKETVRFHNGVLTTYTYDDRLRLRTLFTQSLNQPGTPVFQDLNYTYDQADNITAIDDGRSLNPGEEARSQTASYLMDNLYRLRRAQGTHNAMTLFTIDYDYDRLGNMILKSSGDVADADVSIGNMLSGGTSGTSNRVGRALGDEPGPHALTSTNGGFGTDRVFAYDVNGNMVNNDGDLYTFDFKDRLGKVTIGGSPIPDIRYVYDYNGRRIIKRVDDQKTLYIDKYSEVRGGTLQKYVWNNDHRLARMVGLSSSVSCDYNDDDIVDLSDHEAFLACMDGPGEDPQPEFSVAVQACLDSFDADGDQDVDAFDIFNFTNRFSDNEPSSGSLVFYHTDHLGSTNVVTHLSGSYAAYSVYYPFGMARYEYVAGGPVAKLDYQFTGKEKDDESGLQYFEARFLYAQIARFATADPLISDFASSGEVGSGGAGVLQSPNDLNLYSYVRNKPLTMIDPSGTSGEGFLKQGGYRTIDDYFKDKGKTLPTEYVNTARTIGNVAALLGFIGDLATTIFGGVRETNVEPILEVGGAVQNSVASVFGNMPANAYIPLRRSLIKAVSDISQELEFLKSLNVEKWTFKNGRAFDASGSIRTDFVGYKLDFEAYQAGFLKAIKKNERDLQVIKEGIEQLDEYYIVPDE